MLKKKMKRKKEKFSLNFLVAVLIVLILFLSIQLMLKTSPTPIKLNPGVIEITVVSPQELSSGQTQMILTGHALKAGVAQITVR
jgi:hypothetical protein